MTQNDGLITCPFCGRCFPSSRKKVVQAVLSLLARLGPLNKYNIWKILCREMDITEPTVIYTVSALEKCGLIEVVRIDSHCRGSVPSKWYSVSKRAMSGFSHNAAGDS